MTSRALLCSALLVSTVSLAHADPATDGVGTPDGYFVTVDDKSGQPRGLVEMRRNADGELEGFLRGTFVAGEDMSRSCETCRDELLNQPLYGLRIVYGLDEDTPTKFKKGRVVDPESGDTYKAKVRYSDDFGEVELRGYVGTPILGRSQTWRRATSEEIALIETSNAAVGLPALAGSPEG